MADNLRAPEYYLNRELSWLQFNERVLALAEREDIPLLERLKFVAIAASNLDEFYMVRMGRLENQARIDSESFEMGPDGLSLNEVLEQASQKASRIGKHIGDILSDTLIPALAQQGVHFVSSKTLSDEQRARLYQYYLDEVHPCLTPIAIDPSHPFPILRNASLNLALRLAPQQQNETMGLFERSDDELFAIVQVPSMLPRFVPLPGEPTRYTYMALEEVISLFVADLFPGHGILEAAAFRVTRASGLDITEDEAENLLSTIQDQLRSRDRGTAVRLEVTQDASEAITSDLLELIGVEPRHLHRTPAFLATGNLLKVYGSIQIPRLKDEPFAPLPSPRLRYAPTIFRTIGERDVLLHHPYESFRHVVDFIEQAADDPDVVAIKQTLYRTSGDSPIVRALARAAEKGKDVTALVELKARFDEANNIAWARALERSGVHVVYGLIGLKTHAKLLLVIRREGEMLKRYLHLATGNYNPSTARMYTDLGLFTAREDITYDAMQLFNVLTGYAELPEMNQLIVSPFNLRQHILECIDREIEHAKNGRPAGIRAKMNSLVDGEVVHALYRASQAGVPIELNIRGICCLRPQVPGVSENIVVRSILDRFLEHSRVFWWQNGGDDQLFLSSADWMPRNLNRRIEVNFPILDPDLKKRILAEMMTIESEDNSHAWLLGADGEYHPLVPPDGVEKRRTQQSFIDMYRLRSHKKRTAVRPEIPSTAGLSPAVRAVEAQKRRRQQR